MFADPKTDVAAALPQLGVSEYRVQAQGEANFCRLCTANNRVKEPVLVGTCLLTGGTLVALPALVLQSCNGLVAPAGIEAVSRSL